MGTKNVKWGVLGTAGIAAGCTIPGMKKADGCELYAIAGRSIEKANAFKEKFGFEKAYALQTDLNLNASEIISTYVYKKGLLDGDYGFSTAVGLFNTVINVVLLVSMNAIVKKMNEGKGI